LAAIAGELTSKPEVVVVQKSVSGKSVAARHECARIPFSSRLRRC
jgi:hypothetical protein